MVDMQVLERFRQLPKEDQDTLLNLAYEMSQRIKDDPDLHIQYAFGGLKMWLDDVIRSLREDYQAYQEFPGVLQMEDEERRSDLERTLQDLQSIRGRLWS